MSTGTFTGRLPTAPATAAAIGPAEAVIAPVAAVIAPAEAVIALAVVDTAVVEVIEAGAATVAEAHPTR
jgi:hypothetical protein